MRFTVWAPEASSVVAHVDGDEHPMNRVEPVDRRGASRRGWWAVEVPSAGPGSAYLYSVDGGTPRPDPRSPSQPEGVEGPSAVVEHDSFLWTDEAWRGFHLPGAVLYEVHVGTFSEAGTFESAILHLDHLVELGVDAVELMPVVEFPGARGWGYDGVDLWAPHHAYGGPEGLALFVDACHARGIGVVLDVVYNHLGPAGNHLGTFGPYFTDHHATNWGQGLNVDGPDSDEVRRWVIDNALSWFRRFHIDGLRLDAVHAIADDSATHLLRQLADEVQALAGHVRRPLWLIAESDRNDPRYVLPPAAGGYGLDASWADEWHHAVHAALTGETDGYYRDFGSVAQLARALQQAWVYAGDYSAHRRRVHGTSPEGLPGHAFVVSVQNHDQVGNRARGDRLGHVVTPGRLHVAAALMLTSPFTPMLFQGEEWAASTPFPYFTSHDDPDLGRAVSEGRRREFSYFGWDPEDIPDPQDPATFEAGKLRWDELHDEPHRSLLEWYRSLIALRRAVPELTDGRWGAASVAYDEADRWIRYCRGPVVVAANIGPRPITLPAPGPVTHMLSAGDVEITPEWWRLPADSVVVATT